MNWTNQEIALPKLPEGLKWEILTDTDNRGLKVEKPKTIGKPAQSHFASENQMFTELMADRSVRIYISEKDPSFSKKNKVKRKTK